MAIIDIASTQFPDGGCYHQYQPLTKRGNNDIGGGFNDDPMWLIFGTVAYIKETGDFSILDEMVPFDNEPGSEVTLFDHLRISFDHVVNNLGPHMLPLIGRADWNDCLNLNCFSWDPNESFQTTENKTERKNPDYIMIAWYNRDSKYQVFTSEVLVLSAFRRIVLRWLRWSSMLNCCCLM